jgi:hypothetical protein
MWGIYITASQRGESCQNAKGSRNLRFRLKKHTFSGKCGAGFSLCRCLTLGRADLMVARSEVQATTHRLKPAPRYSQSAKPLRLQSQFATNSFAFTEADGSANNQRNFFFDE